MSLIAEAEVETEHASRYLAELCEHLNDKAQAHPDLQVHVEWSDTHGTADFGWGRCTMTATASLLSLRAQAADQDGLYQVEEFVTRHLERHRTADAVEVDWRQPGAPAADPGDASHRRDTMRQFHRRARS